MKSLFKYIQRKGDRLLVLIPGWASDYRIFTYLDLNFNYLIPVHFSPFTFSKGLLARLKADGIKKVSLFGWSLGGFTAAEFAQNYPDLIDELILVSVRERYRPEEVEAVWAQLNENKEECLDKFYSRCFLKSEPAPGIEEDLLRSYTDVLTLDYLQDGLMFLKNAQIRPRSLDKIAKIKIIHGENDFIAPVQEAQRLKASLPQAEFICLKKTGHLPFLKEGFNGYFNGQRDN